MNPPSLSDSATSQCAMISSPPPPSRASPVLEAPPILDTGGPSTLVPVLDMNPSTDDYAPPSSNTATSFSQQRRFPNNSIRQRSSNVASVDPEIEFLKTSINACRSTIVQQEADIKRLNENLDIRNKKIMQLESQVGVATTYLSSSNANSPNTQQSLSISQEQLNNLTQSINALQVKLLTLPALCSKNQTVNVFNSNQKNPTSDKSSQTSTADPHDISAAVLDTAGAISARNDPLVTAVSGSEEVPSSEENILTCTLCNLTLQTYAQLTHHLEDMHNDTDNPTYRACSTAAPSVKSPPPSSNQSL